MGLPEIRVTFKKLAQDASTRSARGHLAIIVRDATEGVDWTSKTYTEPEGVNESEFTPANYKSIKAAFLAEPYWVSVVRVGGSGTVADAAAALEKLPYNWVCTNVAALQTELSAYVKAVNVPARIRKAKALVCGVSAANDKHVVNVANTAVTLKGETAATSMALYLPRLAAVLAACPMTGSVTYYQLEDLDDIADVTDPGASVDGGNLVLIRDDGDFRIARGVNTLTTLGTDDTEDMRKIAVVEAMDLIQEDIIRTFKANYLAKVRNSADNQALLVSDILGYFRELEAESVLDPDGENTADIDVPKMRRVWTQAGTDVKDLTDAQVRKKTYRSYVYITARIRILDAMEDLIMQISLQ